MLERYDLWMRWPGERASAETPSSEPETSKVAEEELPLDLVSVVHRIVQSVQDEGGSRKTASLRADGTESAPITKANMWRHPNAHPLALALVLLDRYGESFFEWDPLPLKLTLERDGISLSNSVWTKIQSVRPLFTSPSPWRQWQIFHWVCLGLAGHSPNFVYLEIPEPGHLGAGFDMMRSVDPKRETSDEVDKFIAASFRNDGIPYIPDPLSFAQRELEVPRITCKRCGAIHRDDNDVRCVTCGSKKSLEPVPYEYAASRDAVKALYEEHRSAPLEKAVESLPDTPVGLAAHRLLVQWDYVSRVRAQLVDQLRMLRT